MLEVTPRGQGKTYIESPIGVVGKAVSYSLSRTLVSGLESNLDVGLAGGRNGLDARKHRAHSGLLVNAGRTTRQLSLSDDVLAGAGVPTSALLGGFGIGLATARGGGASDWHRFGCRRKRAECLGKRQASYAQAE